MLEKIDFSRALWSLYTNIVRGQCDHNMYEPDKAMGIVGEK